MTDQEPIVDFAEAEIATPPGSEVCSPSPITSLRNLGPMQVAVVREVLADEDDSLRLKSLGICRGRRVQLVKAGDPIILRVLGSRVGLSGRLAQSIMVEPCAAC